MTAQSGRDLLLKIGDGEDDESFTTVAGLRTSELSFNARSIDITSLASDDMWQQLMDGAGLKSAAISGAGIFRDSDADALIRSAFFNQSVRNWQIILPDFGTLSGAFKITALTYLGPYDGALQISMTLTSGGDISFTAEDAS